MSKIESEALYRTVHCTQTS